MTRRPHGTGRIYLRGKIWWLKYYHNGKPVYESSKSDKRTVAEKIMKVRLGDEAAGRALSPGKVSVSQLCALVINDYEITKKRSIYDLKNRIEKHINPMLGDTQASKFDSNVIGDYIRKRREQHASDSTINRELSVVRRGFSLALRERPPLITIPPYIPKLEEDNARQGFLEPEGYQKVLDEMPHQLKALFVVAYHTGMRLGELRKLEWSMVDLAAAEILIPIRNAKTKKARIVPIYGDMVEWLGKQKAERDEKWPSCPYVFFYLGKPIGHRTRGFVKAVTAAGFPSLRPHDLRRSAVRLLDRSGLSRDLSMEISGHKTQSIFSRYNIRSSNDMRDAGKILDKSFKEQQKTIAKKRQKGDTVV